MGDELALNGNSIASMLHTAKNTIMTGTSTALALSTPLNPRTATTAQISPAITDASGRRSINSATRLSVPASIAPSTVIELNSMKTSAKGRSLPNTAPLTSPISVFFTRRPTNRNSVEHPKTSTPATSAINTLGTAPKKLTISLPDANPAPIIVPTISIATDMERKKDLNMLYCMPARTLK